MREIVFRVIEGIGRERSEDGIVLFFSQPIEQPIPIFRHSLEFAAAVAGDLEQQIFDKVVFIGWLGVVALIFRKKESIAQI